MSRQSVRAAFNERAAAAGSRRENMDAKIKDAVSLHTQPAEAVVYRERQIYDRLAADRQPALRRFQRRTARPNPPNAGKVHDLRHIVINERAMEAVGICGHAGADNQGHGEMRSGAPISALRGTFASCLAPGHRFRREGSESCKADRDQPFDAIGGRLGPSRQTGSKSSVWPQARGPR